MADPARERIAQLFRDSGAVLRRRMERFVRSKADAADAVQDAFLRACENSENLQVPGAFVYSAARNVAFDGRRREKSARKALLGEIALSAVNPSVESAEATYLSEERVRLLKEAVERLPPQCRAVFALRIFHGYSYKEIADTLGLSVKTVENHIARAIREAHAFVNRRCGAVKSSNG